MTTTRAKIPDFELANPIYVGATVTFFEADESGVATSTVATLYRSPVGTTTVQNPQNLDSEGKFPAPVYFDTPVIGVVTNSTVPSHSTGVIHPRGLHRGDWVTATRYFTGETITDAATGNVYIAREDHLSAATLAEDVTAENLGLIIDTETIVASATAAGTAAGTTAGTAAGTAAGTTAGEAAGAEFSRYPMGINLKADTGQVLSDQASPEVIELSLSRPVKSTFFYGEILDGDGGSSFQVTYRVGATVKYGPITVTQGTPVRTTGLDIDFATDDQVTVQITNITGNVRHIGTKLDATYATAPGLLYGDFFRSGSAAMTGDLDLDSNNIANVDQINGNTFSSLVTQIGNALQPASIGVTVQAFLASLAQTVWNAGTATTESKISPNQLRTAIGSLEASQSGVPDALILELKDAGVNAGSSAGDTWNIRELNAEYDPNNLVTLGAGNTFTLLKNGWIEGSAPSYAAGTHHLRLWNVTDGVEVPNNYGTSEYITSTIGVQTRSFISCPVEAGKQYRLEHYTSNVRASVGLGFAGSNTQNLYAKLSFYSAHQS